jgi:SAM-dependent methyltransferase
VLHRLRINNGADAFIIQRGSYWQQEKIELTVPEQTLAPDDERCCTACRLAKGTVGAMIIMKAVLMRAFGRPRGVLGRLGGYIMARTNAESGNWVCELLQIERMDSVLEIGFGPGVVIEHLLRRTEASRIAGIDQSRVMVDQARARNVVAIQNGRVELECGSVESLPFRDDSFNKVLTVNSMQYWPHVSAGLGEIRRVMKPGGLLALGFTPYSGQSKEGLVATLDAAGFANTGLMEHESKGFCVFGSKPQHGV